MGQFSIIISLLGFGSSLSSLFNIPKEIHLKIFEGKHPLEMC